MSSKGKTILFAVALVLFIAGSGVVYRVLKDRVETPPMIEEPQNGEGEAGDEPMLAPDFTVSDFEGNEYRLSDFRGKPVVLNF